MKRYSKQDNKQIYKYIVILVILIVFVLTIGLKLLVNVSLFMAGLLNKDKFLEKQTTTEESYILPPEIYDVPDATNSANLIIHGRASVKNELSIFVNDESQKTMTPNDDSFEAEIKLEKGENSIYVQIRDNKTKEKKESPVYKTIYIKDKPTLEIESPHDGDKIKKDEISVIGQIDKNNEVRINSAPVVINSEGKFSHTFKLSPGDNKIKIEVSDIAGNNEEKEITVTYEKED